jgi:uncharacterized protein
VISYKYLLLLCVLNFTSVVDATPSNEVSLPRTTIVTLKDLVNKRSYDIHIQLPIHYMPDKKYPVVYMTDSPYTFPIAVGAARYPANFKKLEDVFYVGISWQSDVSPGFSRQRDYTPTLVTKGYKDPTGEADKHLQFIRQTVIPYVENNYSTAPDNRTYLGNSYGGLFGAYILLSKPSTFKNYILGSPSLWWDDRYIFKLEEKSRVQLVNINVFLSVGAEEYANSESTKNDLLGDTRKFQSRLIKGKQKNSKIELQVIQAANHETAFPTTAIQGLWWLFNKKDGVAI